MLNITEKTEIVFHFNKKSLVDQTIPMWVVKVKGKTYYVDHLESEIGFSTKETPNSTTKGSLKFKGSILIEEKNGIKIAIVK